MTVCNVKMVARTDEPTENCDQKINYCRFNCNFEESLPFHFVLPLFHYISKANTFLTVLLLLFIYYILNAEITFFVMEHL